MLDKGAVDIELAMPSVKALFVDGFSFLKRVDRVMRLITNDAVGRIANHNVKALMGLHRRKSPSRMFAKGTFALAR